MTVLELVKFLQEQRQDLIVAFEMFSEQCVLETNKIKLKELCEPRPDGWVENKRPDKPTRMYLVLPGN